jgi:hypothetical protein
MFTRTCCKSHYFLLTNFENHVKVKTEIHAMMRKPHTDCYLIPAAFMRQGAGEGTFM